MHPDLHKFITFYESSNEATREIKIQAELSVKITKSFSFLHILESKNRMLDTIKTDLATQIEDVIYKDLKKLILELEAKVKNLTFNEDLNQTLVYIIAAKARKEAFEEVLKKLKEIT